MSSGYMPRGSRPRYWCVSLLTHVELSNTPIPIKVLKLMLTVLTGLKRLHLDLPLGDFIDREDEEDQDEMVVEEESPDVIFPGENAFLKAIEKYASSKLEHLQLTFQTLFRMPVEALCSLFRNHPTLHTIKLVDVDIEKHMKKDKDKKKKKKKKNNEAKDKLRTYNADPPRGPATKSLLSLLSSGSSTSGPSLSPPPTEASSATSEDETELSRMPMNQTPEHFRLTLFSITSSHSSDTSLGYILERFSYLGALHLHSCDSITDEILNGIAQHLLSLKSISLSSCKKFTPAGLDRFFSNTHQLLVHVHICDLTALHDETLEILAGRHAQSLRKLAVYFCSFVTDRGVKALLTACGELRVLGLQAYGMTTNIFEDSWACQRTLEQLDLQAVFKLFGEDTPSTANGEGSSNSNGNNNVDSSAETWGNLQVRTWRDTMARVEAFGVTRFRLMTLLNLRNLRLSASGIGKEVLGGFGQDQRIEVLHLYGLQSTQIDSLPWKEVKMRYPFLKQIYCATVSSMKKSIKDDLAGLNVELLASSSMPDLAFKNDFDDRLPQ
ncbi:hypothetical protein BGZ65_005510 [Modicella reniformis]|uniref:RNI-like protein n=1 Tax=Modicella reniformis TaxID=1440133 RepID=A0A9P6J5F2_9FUNG|nr:hypothetical protein BGZ65_005510 [Modicella reniformis]